MELKVLWTKKFKMQGRRHWDDRGGGGGGGGGMAPHFFAQQKEKRETKGQKNNFQSRNY